MIGFEGETLMMQVFAPVNLRLSEEYRNPPLSLSPMGRGARVWLSGVCIFAIYLYYARYE